MGQDSFPGAQLAHSFLTPGGRRRRCCEATCSVGPLPTDKKEKKKEEKKIKNIKKALVNGEATCSVGPLPSDKKKKKWGGKEK
jgi:hypothetical protein